MAFATFSFSQQLSRYVVSSGGNYSNAGGYSNSSTIGESMVTTLTSASNVLTQGFQQSFSNSVDPTITIINPLDGDVFPNNNNIGIDFSITDFVVAAGTGDGHIHYYVNGAMTMKYDTLPITLNGLANGSHQIIIELVDNSHQGFSPTIADTVNFSVNVISGCTDPTYCNYDSLATLDDGSCAGMFGCTDPLYVEYNAAATCDDGSCVTLIVNTSCGAITGVNLTDVIHDRAQFNWDDMNSATCVVDQIRIRYSDDGGATYSNKTMGAPVGNSAPCLNTSKLVLNLTPSTVYVYDFKIWYQDGSSVNWHANGTFTTADVCLNATNMTATPTSTTQADFCWDAPASAWEFVRLQYRENVAGSSFSNIGGFGVMAPALCKTKNGLVAGTEYRVMWRTWCNATGGPYRSPVWDGPVVWTQPTVIRLAGGTTINNLAVYPNPSRDIFNVSFTSEDAQDLDVRVLNVVGEVVYTENLEQFVGEYTKAIDLATYTKGVYFLEITTNNGVVNKKLILQ